MKLNFKEGKGITLIALVITIIVLLILAGVTINTLTGENGIITQVQKASNTTKLEQAKEEIRLSVIEYKTMEYQTVNNLKGYKNWVQEKKSGKIEGEQVLIELDNDENPIEATVTYKTYEIKLNEDLEIQKVELGDSEDNGGDESTIQIPEVVSYVQDGLILHYDGINNTGSGHSNSVSTWKDLSGNNNNATLNGCTWADNCLNFDGIDDWVNCGQKNYSNVTIEVVCLYNEVPTTEVDIVANWNSGGYGLNINDSKNGNKLNFNGTYSGAISDDVAMENKIYGLYGTFDGNKICLYENGRAYETNNSNAINPTLNSTVFALGANPNGSEAEGNYLNGKIYSVRLYNRALTAEEIRNNYEIDKVRFGIDGTTVNEEQLNSKIKLAWVNNLATVNAETEESYILQYSTDNSNWLSNGESNKVTIENLQDSDKVYFRLKQGNNYGSETVYNINYNYKYANSGLMIHYDGINNSGSGHSNSVAKWKDLSGNNNDGELNGCTWEENGLSFNGETDWVNCGTRNYSNVTIQVVVKYDDIPTETGDIVVGNCDGGGYDINILNSKNRFETYIGNVYQMIEGKGTAVVNKLYSLSGSYNGNKIVLWENNVKNETAVTGSFGATQNSTIFVLGANPSANDVTGQYLDGKICSFRLYNRALTDEEVKNNYEIDKHKYGVE